jgi:hypothetical protein
MNFAFAGPVMGSTQYSVEAPSFPPGLKQPQREDYYSPPPNAET